jgi:glycerophosphoryl diester phosphodiesterase
MTYYIKIITGFREDQEISVPLQEAHKAYYLFSHPEARTIFSTGDAIVGKDIQRIVPDYNRTMGWNTTHKLTDEDFNQINGRGVADKMRDLQAKASDISLAMADNPRLGSLKLQEIIDNPKVLTLN